MKSAHGLNSHGKSRRGFLLTLGGLGAATAAFGTHTAVFYQSLGDPSSSSPLYDGPLLPDAIQHPVDTGFTHTTRAIEVVKGLDLTGKTVVITGGHSGTGREAARALASAGARIIALSRDIERARNNLSDIRNARIEYMDLLKPESIDAVARKVVASGEAVHILINSAAIMGTPQQYDARGYERQFATNVLGHYQLTARLLPALTNANGARIVNLASRGHRAGGVNFDDIHFRKTPYTGMSAYAQTKTAQALMAVVLDKKLKSRNIRALAVHPGAVPSTDLFAAGRVGYDSAGMVELARLNAGVVRATHMTEIMNAFRSPENTGDIYKTVEQGGATTTWAASAAMLENTGGVYLEDCNFAPMVPDGSPAPFGVRPWALDPGFAERLLRGCEEMTGVKLL